MMIVGVVSDTHIPTRVRQLPSQLLEGLKGVDRIIHCGDILIPQVLGQLWEIAPVDAVLGNMDSPAEFPNLPYRKVIEVGGFRLGIIHGHSRSGSTIQRARDGFAEGAVDCILFGHSHIPVIEERNGILMLNPGSPTDKRMQKQYSYGKLYLDKRIRPELVFF
ncbi:MAG: metallophosphoesterase family protein [Clostridia bacterium]|jgi:putative phosphoesterase